MRKTDLIKKSLGALGLAVGLFVACSPIKAYAATTVNSWSGLQTAFDNGGEVSLQTDITDGSDKLIVPSGKNVVLDLAGYKIDRNLSSPQSEGYVIEVLGNLTIDDSSSRKTGKITGGNNDSTGGGLYVNGGILVLENGSIEGNYAGIEGGGVYLKNNAQVFMNGGHISGNIADYSGGGVYVGGNSTFSMQSGFIEKNTTYNTDTFSGGGGVYIDDGSTFIMRGGYISLNSSASYGGGVRLGTYNSNVAVFDMRGGSIINNTAAASFNGGGVFVPSRNDVLFKVQGGSVIKDNTIGGTISGSTLTGGTRQNVYTLGQLLQVTGPLTGNIGVDVPDDKRKNAFAKAASTYNSGDLKDTDIKAFSSDNTNYAVCLNDNFQALFGLAITSNHVKVDHNLIYDTNDRSRAVSVVKDGVTLTRGNDYNVVFKQNNVAVIPKDAGTYTVEVTGIGDYAGTVTTNLIIDKKTVTVSGITVFDKSYDGSTKANLDCSKVTFRGICGGDVLSVTATGKFDDADVGENKNVIIGITLGGLSSDNYVLAASGNQTSATASIFKGASKVVTAPTAKTGLVYNGAAQQLIDAGTCDGGTFKYALGSSNATASSAGDFTDTVPSATEVGSYYVWYKVVGDKNHYDTDPVCLTVSIAKSSDVADGSGNQGSDVSPSQTEKAETVDKKQKTTSFTKITGDKGLITITWKKQTKGGIKGYEIQYSTDKKFKKNVKVVTVKKAKTTTKTIKKLKSKKKYYIRIRTFRKSGKEYIYSKWSKVKKIKVK